MSTISSSKSVLNSVGVIIQARNGSSRLPGKVMMDLAGKKAIERVVERVQAAKEVARVIVATTTDAIDDAMAKFLQDKGIVVFRGSALDVLDRYYQAAKAHQLSNIVRITADCPLIDPVIIDQVISTYRAKGVDYCSNVLKRTYPDGLDTEVFSFEALSKAWREGHLPKEREHVTTYIRQHPELFKLWNVELHPSLGHKRWTLDYPEDLQLIQKIYGCLKDKHEFNMQDILQCISLHPEWEKINAKYVSA